MIPGLSYFKIAAIGGLLVAGAIVYFYISYLKSENKTLTENNATLTVAVDTQKETIEILDSAVKEWKKSQEEFGKTLEKLNNFSQNASSELSRIRGIFAKHDLERLAIGKQSKMLERRVNSGTNANNRLLENITARNKNNSDRGGETGSDSSNTSP